MLNGTFRNPTVIHFGPGVVDAVGSEVMRHAPRTVLVHFGRASYAAHGLRQRISRSLEDAGMSFVELGGVQANPESDLVHEGIDLCRREGVDLILAVGGGSVIDSAKAIAIGVPYGGDVWDFFEKKAVPVASLKVGVVLTLCGAGSESSEGAVITHTAQRRKLDCGNPLMYPVFAFLDPVLPLTAPRSATFHGIVDALSHVFERYFTQTTGVTCTDRIAEGLMLTLMEQARCLDRDPGDMNARAELMWACKVAHDNTAGFGRKHDWACHRISHEIGARCGAAHGAILAVVFPAWMTYVHPGRERMFLQWAYRVFGLDPEALGERSTIAEAINRYRRFLASLGLPRTLRELGFTDRSALAEVAAACGRSMPSGTVGNFARLAPGDIEAILDLVF